MDGPPGIMWPQEKPKSSVFGQAYSLLGRTCVYSRQYFLYVV